jgi:hypothetical protein
LAASNIQANDVYKGSAEILDVVAHKPDHIIFGALNKLALLRNCQHRNCWKSSRILFEAAIRVKHRRQQERRWKRSKLEVDWVVNRKACHKANANINKLRQPFYVGRQQTAAIDGRLCLKCFMDDSDINDDSVSAVLPRTAISLLSVAKQSLSRIAIAVKSSLTVAAKLSCTTEIRNVYR